MAETTLYTASQIADQLSEPPQRVTYIIRKYRLKPVQRVGIIRLFNQEQIRAIQQGLYGIQISRGMSAGPPFVSTTGRSSQPVTADGG